MSIQISRWYHHLYHWQHHQVVIAMFETAAVKVRCLLTAPTQAVQAGEDVVVGVEGGVGVVETEVEAVGGEVVRPMEVKGHGHSLAKGKVITDPVQVPVLSVVGHLLTQVINGNSMTRKVINDNCDKESN